MRPIPLLLLFIPLLLSCTQEKSYRNMNSMDYLEGAWIVDSVKKDEHPWDIQTEEIYEFRKDSSCVLHIYSPRWNKVRSDTDNGYGLNDSTFRFPLPFDSAHMENFPEDYNKYRFVRKGPDEFKLIADFKLGMSVTGEDSVMYFSRIEQPLDCLKTIKEKGEPFYGDAPVDTSKIEGYWKVEARERFGMILPYRGDPMYYYFGENGKMYKFEVGSERRDTARYKVVEERLVAQDSITVGSIKMLTSDTLVFDPVYNKELHKALRFSKVNPEEAIPDSLRFDIHDREGEL